ncbi:MAG: SPFH domain-containing protein [bacterium]
MQGLLIILLAIGCIVIPIVYQASVMVQIVCATFGIMVLIVAGIVVTITKLYRKTSANEAFVRTGMGGMKVIMDGGALYIPVIHKIVPVSLESMKLAVNRTNEEAMITRDSLRVDIEAEFYIKVNANKEDVVNAARALGDKAVSAENVSSLVFEKLVSALRSVAATKDLIELQSKRIEFADSVLEACKHDLAQNGLTLETVTISKLDQTDPTNLSDSNIFDAQGKRKIAEITQEANVRRNEIEKAAQQAIENKNVETTKAILNLQLDQKRAEAEQQRDVKVAQAEANKASEIFRIQQEQEVQMRDIERNRTIQEGAVAQQKVVETATVEKEKTVEVTQRNKEIAVANAEQQKAEAEKNKLLARVEQEKANQEVMNVEKIRNAQREADMRLVDAKMEIEKQKLNQQMHADVEAYKQVKIAEGQKLAAQNEAEAIIRKAEAEKQAKVLAAEGERARQIVPVDVSREQVSVNAAQVEVDRKAMEYKATYERVSVEFELSKKRIDVEGGVKKAFAEALGTMFSHGRMNIFGDPTTLSKMTSMFMQAAGFGMAMQGLSEAVPEEVKAAAGKAADGAGAVLKDLAEKLAATKAESVPPVPGTQEGGGTGGPAVA